MAWTALRFCASRVATEGSPTPEESRARPGEDLRAGAAALGRAEAGVFCAPRTSASMASRCRAASFSRMAIVSVIAAVSVSLRSRRKLRSRAETIS